MDCDKTCGRDKWCQDNCGPDAGDSPDSKCYDNCVCHRGRSEMYKDHSKKDDPQVRFARLSAQEAGNGPDVDRQEQILRGIFRDSRRYF